MQINGVAHTLITAGIFATARAFGTPRFLNGDAQNRLTKLDDREPEQVEEFRDRARGRMNRNRDRKPYGRG
jgi:hypothetical protein